MNEFKSRLNEAKETASELEKIYPKKLEEEFSIKKMRQRA